MLIEIKIDYEYSSFLINIIINQLTAINISVEAEFSPSNDRIKIEAKFKQYLQFKKWTILQTYKANDCIYTCTLVQHTLSYMYVRTTHSHLSA